MHIVIILTCSSGFDGCPLHMAPLTFQDAWVTEDFPGNKVSLMILYRLTPCTEVHVSFDVKCPLLPDFNRNWYVLTEFSRTPQYQIS
jgi:hypothetical protein